MKKSLQIISCIICFVCYNTVLFNAFAKDVKNINKAENTIKIEDKNTASSNENIKKIANTIKHSFAINRNFAKQDFSYNTPNANSILRFSDMKSNGIGGSYQIKINQNQTFGIDATYSSVMQGFGSDDDITNKAGTFSVHDIRGSMFDLNTFAKFNINQYLQYGFGYSFKQYNLQMYNMYQFGVDDNFLNPYFKAVTDGTNFQRTNARMQTVYTSLDFNPNENTLFYLQLHTGQYRGYNDWQTYQWTLNSKSNASSFFKPQNGYGFVAGFKGKFKATSYFDIEYFAKYDSFVFKDLVENDLGYDGNYILQSNYKSQVLFSRMMMGVGLLF